MERLTFTLERRTPVYQFDDNGRVQQTASRRKKGKLVTVGKPMQVKDGEKVLTLYPLERNGEPVPHYLLEEDIRYALS